MHIYTNVHVPDIYIYIYISKYRIQQYCNTKTYSVPRATLQIYTYSSTQSDKESPYFESPRVHMGPMAVCARVCLPTIPSALIKTAKSHRGHYLQRILKGGGHIRNHRDRTKRKKYHCISNRLAICIYNMILTSAARNSLGRDISRTQAQHAPRSTKYKATTKLVASHSNAVNLLATLRGQCLI